MSAAPTSAAQPRAEPREWDVGDYERWYRHGPLASFVRSMHTVSAPEAVMLEAVQPAGDMSDPAVPSVIVGMILPEFAPTQMVGDLGGGRGQSAVAGGALFCVPPDFATTIMVDGPHSLAVLSVPAQQAATLLQGDAEASIDFGALHAGLWNDDYAQASMQRLRELMRPEHDAHSLAREAVVASLLHHLQTRAVVQPADRPARAGLTQRQVGVVRDRLQADLRGPTSLETLAASVGLSPFHFCRAFKRTLGRSPMQYLIELRLVRAAELLRSTDLAVAEVGAMVGYDDPAYFARLFRQRRGHAPLAWRRGG